MLFFVRMCILKALLVALGYFGNTNEKFLGRKHHLEWWNLFVKKVVIQWVHMRRKLGDRVRPLNSIAPLPVAFVADIGHVQHSIDIQLVVRYCKLPVGSCRQKISLEPSLIHFTMSVETLSMAHNTCSTYGWLPHAEQKGCQLFQF